MTQTLYQSGNGNGASPKIGAGVLIASKVPEVAVPCANQFLTLQNMEDLVSEVDRTEQGLPVDLGSSSSGLGEKTGNGEVTVMLKNTCHGSPQLCYLTTSNE
ncbi:hypothetical protein RHGRI_003702 [Rhododendron griersonianum]|uniref:Uncharacterized protein n=1 Tax=Rhododendron griersonianum TaxID=479676 RepID=A0AAV6L5Z9_9ERIC|nr:hypothetical protein RHGRI_003702 [Rhododendron griersonianum]